MGESSRVKKLFDDIKLNELNDDEINLAVAELRPEVEITEKGIFIKRFLVASIPDYCNNPSDADPIIEKYKINLEYHPDLGDWEASMTLEDGNGEPYYAHRAWNETRLIAAMICFLKMKQGE